MQLVVTPAEELELEPLDEPVPVLDELDWMEELEVGELEELKLADALVLLEMVDRAGELELDPAGEPVLMLEELDRREALEVEDAPELLETVDRAEELELGPADKLALSPASPGCDPMATVLTS